MVKSRYSRILDGTGEGLDIAGWEMEENIERLCTCVVWRVRVERVEAEKERSREEVVVGGSK
jgi:hypothetical protein